MVGATHEDNIELRALEAWRGSEGDHLREDFTILWVMDRIATTSTPWFVAMGTLLPPVGSRSGSV